MKKILISDPVHIKSVDILTSSGFEVDYKPGIPVDEIKNIIKNYNALIVRSETKVNAELISLMDNMEVIGRAGAGVDNIDVNAATRKGIIVMNAPGGNTISAAEHTIALILSMCRNIPQADNSVKNGKWQRKLFQGTELYGKTIGIIGLGKIGREVAARAKSFEMNVIGYDPVLSEEVASKLGVDLVSLEKIFSDSDIITVHVPLDDKTKNLISKETLKKCKDGVKIVNCARGGIINEDDIVEALNSGKVSSAAFDVYTKEPPDFEHPLFKHPKVILTPHLGASTEEAQEKVAIQISEQIIDVFQSKDFRGVINASALSLIGNKDLTPYIKLAEKIGILHSQLLNNKLKKIKIFYYGDLVSKSSQLLSAAIIKGFLSKVLPETLNYINAPFIAKEMGISLEETQAGLNPDYTNLITVECYFGDKKKLLSGTVFGNSEIRIVQVDDFHFEINPEGNLLFYTNIDKPGILANVGKFLAESNINIAGLSLGRTGIGKEALTVINIDTDVPQEVINKIKMIEGVSNIYSVKI